MYVLNLKTNFRTESKVTSRNYKIDFTNKYLIS